ncbi:MAG: DnaK suppressor protein [Microbacteriaceae bacterium]|nr:DnaK suppressor protein [Microbacteriaceae bacterium]
MEMGTRGPRWDRVQFAHFERALLARRVELDAQFGITQAELEGVRQARADASADDEHDPEGSTLSSDWSRIQGLEENISRQRLAIDAALQRIDDGSYGICVRCGKPVGIERLEARPASELCIVCARALE